MLPTFTTSQSGPELSPGQLIFAGAASLGLYVLFLFTQTVRHRDFFLPVAQRARSRMTATPIHRAPARRC